MEWLSHACGSSASPASPSTLSDMPWHRKCMHDLPWCQERFTGLIEGGNEPGTHGPFGGHRLAKVPDETLRLWLKRELRKTWGTAQVCACVQNKGRAIAGNSKKLYSATRICHWCRLLAPASASLRVCLPRMPGRAVNSGWCALRSLLSPQVCLAVAAAGAPCCCALLPVPLVQLVAAAPVTCCCCSRHVVTDCCWVSESEVKVSIELEAHLFRLD